MKGMKVAFIGALVVCFGLLVGAWTHGISGGTAPYEGLVASRARIANSLDTTNKQIMARAAVISTEALSSVKLVIGNLHLTDPDAGTGASMTCSASIEYNGAFTQGKWSSATSVTMADGTIAFSDSMTISGGIPSKTTFYVRQFCTSTGGIVYFNASSANNFFNEASSVAVTGLSDQTMSGTITNANNNYKLPPIAILAQTTNPSVIVVGDSIAYGVNGIEDGNLSISEYNGKNGIITPSLGSTPFLNLSLSSEVAQFWIARATARKLLIPKASNLIIQLGNNDLNVNSRTPSQLVADRQGIAALARPGQKTYGTTLTPESSSTDGWTTTGNQCPAANGFQCPIGQPNHAAFDTLVRAGISGFTGYYDVASATETSQDSDIWVASCSVACTGDGVHGNNNSYFTLIPGSSAGVAMGAQTYP